MEYTLKDMLSFAEFCVLRNVVPTLGKLNDWHREEEGKIYIHLQNYLIEFLDLEDYNIISLFERSEEEVYLGNIGNLPDFLLKLLKEEHFPTDKKNDIINRLIGLSTLFYCRVIKYSS